jgi:type II secretory pathway component PulL
VDAIVVDSGHDGLREPTRAFSAPRFVTLVLACFSLCRWWRLWHPEWLSSSTDSVSRDGATGFAPPQQVTEDATTELNQHQDKV